MDHVPTSPDYAALAATLEATGNYRVLRRRAPRRTVTPADGRPTQLRPLLRRHQKLRRMRHRQSANYLRHYDILRWCCHRPLIPTRTMRAF